MTIKNISTGKLTTKQILLFWFGLLCGFLFFASVGVVVIGNMTNTLGDSIFEELRNAILPIINASSFKEFISYLGFLLIFFFAGLCYILFLVGGLWFIFVILVSVFVQWWK